MAVSTSGSQVRRDEGEMFTDFVLYVNNSEGKIPFSEKKEKAVFRQTLSKTNLLAMFEVAVIISLQVSYKSGV